MSEGEGEPAGDPLAEMIAQIMHDMGDTWRQDDQLLERLFPIDPRAAFSFQQARKALYNDNRNQKRWKGIPSSPKSVARLYTPLRVLMNEILYYYGTSDKTRLFLDTHLPNKQVVSSPPSPFTPSIFLSGVGDEFANFFAESPRAVTQSGVSAVEVVLDSDDFMAARARLAVNMHLMFQNQDNRRFAYGLIVTQSTFTVYMFDHSGTIASRPCNYHQNPEHFCAVISGLACDDAVRAGFDMTMIKKRPTVKIRTVEPNTRGLPKKTHYLMKDRLFQFYSLVGRGTLCWLTTGPAGRTYVVKDAWIAPSELPGRESEGSLLRHAQSMGVTMGVAQIRHFEDVRRSANPADLDTVLRNRRVEGISPKDDEVERVHTRIVLATHGKPLDKFATRMELLLAFHDAVLAHRRLHEIAGILHRDISVRNILINPDGIAGDRGILIDFDHAIRIADTSPYSTKMHMGTYRYMSRNVHDAAGPHTYLDDLESFYYVLCWILVSYEKPGTGIAQPPAFLPSWDQPGSSTLKEGLFHRAFRLHVAPWFGSSLRQLATRLHQFFQSRFASIGKPLSALDPRTDYDEYLSAIQQAIADLEREAELEAKDDPPEHEPNPSEAPQSLQPLSRKRARGMDTGETEDEDDEESDGDEDEEEEEEEEAVRPRSRRQRTMRARKTVSIIPKRPRRSTADYREPILPFKRRKRN